MGGTTAQRRRRRCLPSCLGTGPAAAARQSAGRRQTCLAAPHRHTPCVCCLGTYQGPAARCADHLSNPSRFGSALAAGKALSPAAPEDRSCRTCRGTGRSRATRTAVTQSAFECFIQTTSRCSMHTSGPGTHKKVELTKGSKVPDPQGTQGREAGRHAHL